MPPDHATTGLLRPMSSIRAAISGGPFVDSYHVVKGIDEFMPVDVFIPGCPPRPEALIHGMLELKRKIQDGEIVRDKA